MPRNPSELARLEDEYEYWATKVLSQTTPKADKQHALIELNKVAKQLGIEHPSYNSTEFASTVSKRLM
jgi:hypothetical protein